MMIKTLLKKCRFINSVMPAITMHVLGVSATMIAFLIPSACTASGSGSEVAFQVNEQNADRTPRWSSDGSTIVVNIYREVIGVNTDGYKLWRIPNRGEDYTDEYSPSVSPEGRVAYMKFKYNNRGFLSNLDPNPAKRYIETANIDGSDVKSIAKIKGRGTSIPVWSPDGSRIAFFTGERHATMAGDGSDVQNTGMSSGVWSNDGKRVAAVSFEQFDTYNIVTARWDGKDRRVVAEIDNVDDWRFLSTLDWSPSDDIIYFAKRNWIDEDSPAASVKLYSVDSDGGELHMIADLGEGFKVDEIAVSPDGSELLFVNTDASQRRDGVYLINTDGTNLRNLTSRYDFTNEVVNYSRLIFTGPSRHASWSPDGSMIAVHNHGAYPIIDGRELLLFTIARDGSYIRTLISGSPPGPGRGKLLQPEEDPAVAE